VDSTGRRWERRAERSLRGHGLTTIARNFSAKCGEIDLVMRDGDHSAFIEVRYRRRSRFGDAASSVTLKKTAKNCALRATVFANVSQMGEPSLSV
jgi:putative endonuclease